MKYKAMRNSYGFLYSYWEAGQVTPDTELIPPKSKMLGNLFEPLRPGDRIIVKDGKEYCEGGLNAPSQGAERPGADFVKINANVNRYPGSRLDVQKNEPSPVEETNADGPANCKRPEPISAAKPTRGRPKK